jgi:hypothetical protein
MAFCLKHGDDCISGGFFPQYQVLFPGKFYTHSQQLENSSNFRVHLIYVIEVRKYVDMVQYEDSSGISRQFLKGGGNRSNVVYIY